MSTALREDLPPFLRHAGVDVDSWEDGRAEVSLRIGAHHLNRTGVVHGGIYTVLVDAAGGLAGCYSADPERRVLAYTVSLTTSFLGRADRGVLRAVGRVRRRGKRIFFATVEIDCGGELVALGEGSFMFAQGAEPTHGR